MRRLKTELELIREGYNAEGVLVFLNGFFEEETERLLNGMITCPARELETQRELYRYIIRLKSSLQQKVETGIRYATEHGE